MKQRYLLKDDDIELFRNTMNDVKKLRQDTVTHSSIVNKQKAVAPKRLLQEQIDACFYFSDEFQPHLEEGPTRYLRPGYSHFELKKLRRGDYVPELFLDLHGLTQLQAKQEVGALICACQREHVHCACVMHGHGKHILKQQLPLWLAQHPDILAFHQAPKEWGGNAALLVLIELPD